MLTNRLGENQQFVTRTLRVVMVLLVAMAAHSVWKLSRPGASELYWIELLSLVVAIGVLSVALIRQRRIHTLLRAQQTLNAELRASEAKFSGILEIAADAIIVIDESQKIIHFNRGAEEIFGYAASEIVGEPLQRLLPERFRTAHTGFVQSFAAGTESARRMGHRRAVSGIRKDGTEFPAEAAISKLDVADTERVFSVVLRDITEQKFVEDAERFIAQATADMTRSLDVTTVTQQIVEDSVRMLADGCVLELITDGESRLTAHAADERKRSLLITLAEEFCGEDAALVPPYSLTDAANVIAPEAISEAWLATNVTHETARLLWRDLGVVARLTMPLTAGGRMLGALVLFDFGSKADRFAAQKRFVADEFVRSAALAIDNARLYATARQATRVRDEVLGLVSHDLRNPIGAIAMCARILREAPPEDAAQRDRMVSAISESAVWMQRLIRDLLDVTSIDAGHLNIDRQPSTVATIVSGSAGFVMAELATRSLELHTVLEPNLPLVNVDAGRIIQVLSNLLGNAIKFTTAPGTITLSVCRSVEGVVFSVTDTGVGIPSAAQHQIFDRFWQERPTPSGHGLGLAIAQGIVREHGGRIWVESEVGKGSVFSFVIPDEMSSQILPPA
ncbi:MAG: ATP-binding protein [Gemmatimonadaceae bacterium]